MSKVFYPECAHLDPNTRSGGNFFCEWRGRYVVPATSVYTRRVIRRAPGHKFIFHPDRCAPDCRQCEGKTRVPVL